MLIVKPIHDMLMWESGGLTSDFNDSDKRRYSSVVVFSAADDPLLNFTCISYSSTGSGRQGETIWTCRTRTSSPPDYEGVMSMLKDGEHLVRYMNKPYFDKHGDDTWV